MLNTIKSYFNIFNAKDFHTQNKPERPCKTHRIFWIQLKAIYNYYFIYYYLKITDNPGFIFDEWDDDFRKRHSYYGGPPTPFLFVVPVWSFYFYLVWDKLMADLYDTKLSGILPDLISINKTSVWFLITLLYIYFFLKTASLISLFNLNIFLLFFVVCGLVKNGLEPFAYLIFLVEINCIWVLLFLLLTRKNYINIRVKNTFVFITLAMLIFDQVYLESPFYFNFVSNFHTTQYNDFFILLFCIYANPLYLYFFLGLILLINLLLFLIAKSDPFPKNTYNRTKPNSYQANKTFLSKWVT